MSTQPTQTGLFPETEIDRVQRLDAEILALLCGEPGGKFREPLPDNERAVLRAIRFHRGVAKALPIRSIATVTQLSDRQIKAAVRELRLRWQLPICSSKHASQGGYFLGITREDLAVWKGDLLDQIRAEITVFRAATSEEDALDMIAQLRAGVTA